MPNMNVNNYHLGDLQWTRARRNGEVLNVLQPLKYQSHDLALAVQGRTRCLSRRSEQGQMNDVASVRERIRQSRAQPWIPNLQERINYYTTELAFYNDIFSRNFFFGGLSSYTTGYSWELSRDTNLTITGSSTDFREAFYAGRSANTSEIVVFRRDDEPTDIEVCVTTVHDQLLEYLGTLLHEQCHSLFSLYACACEDCEDHVLRFEGQRGHMSAWQEVAYATEREARRTFRLNLDLKRQESLAIDMALVWDTHHNFDRENVATWRWDVEAAMSISNADLQRWNMRPRSLAWMFEEELRELQNSSQIRLANYTASNRRV